MTDLEQRQPALAVAPPPSMPLGRTTPAGRVLAVMVLALTLAGLLNSRAFVGATDGMPMGWQRTGLRMVALPMDWAAQRLRLDQPRARLDRALGREVDIPASTDPADDPAVVAAGDIAGPAAGPAAGPGAATPFPAPPVAAPPLRDATAAAPLRLFITGDSMIESFAGKLVNRADDAGAVKSQIEIKYGTGLCRPDFFDWSAHARAAAAQRKAEAVILMMGGNDGQNIDLGSRILTAGTPEWQAEYQKRALRVMTAFTQAGTRVYWIGMPPARSNKLTPRYRSLNAGLAAAAASVPGVTYIDSWGLFSKDDKYSAYLPRGGRQVLMRARDGIHLSKDGAQLLAERVFPVLDADWKLSR